MQELVKAKELFAAAKLLGVSGKQFIAFAKKNGIDEATAKSVLAENGVSEKRRTFRTVVQEAFIALLLEKPEAKEEEAYKLFDALIVKEYGSATAPKASNSVKHKDYYIATCFTFGKALLDAKAKAEAQAPKRVAK